MRLVLAAIAVLTSFPALAQGAPDATNQQLTAAMQCVAFGSSAKTDALDAEAARLAVYAFGLAATALDAARSAPPAQLDPLARVLQTQGGPTFYVGMQFAEAEAVTTNVLLEDVPPGSYSGDVTAEIKAQQQASATEFAKRNCDLIGK